MDTFDPHADVGKGSVTVAPTVTRIELEDDRVAQQMIDIPQQRAVLHVGKVRKCILLDRVDGTPLWQFRFSNGLECGI